ncbi:unnamed protein product [Caenorhabditis bovis]|uniref:BZIP domain-containing protein n=1 Tax=Caenorhabditis bovis TaxID=2654633 RepID=A0A8S1EIG2_9PELO|nr:unnamed protein product [Caenorhabditis bovis]
MLRLSTEMPTTVGFSTWPPTPPLPPLARAPPSDPGDHPQHLRRQTHNLNSLSREFESADTELIVLQQNDCVKFPTSKIMSRRLHLNEEASSSMMNYEIESHYDDYFYGYQTNTSSDHQNDLSTSSIDNFTPDLQEMDALMSCDIRSLDEFIHDDKSDSTYLNDVSDSSSSQFSPDSDADLIGEFFPQYSHQNKSPSSSSRKFSTCSSSDASDYRLKRDKNNISSQKSRAKRQAVIQALREEKEILERKKVELTTLVGTLEAQVEDYKRMVMMFVKE